jgi:tRNA(Ile)-lysidine synthase
MLEGSHYADADALLCAAAGKLELPGRLRLEISGGTGLISDNAGRPRIPKDAFSVSVGGTTRIPALNIVVRTKPMPAVSSPSRLVRLCTPNRQYFDADAVRFPLEIRVRRPGDSFAPLGIRGSKKLKDFFIDRKVPRFLRNQVPLLVSGGKIMWVMGYGIDRRFSLASGSTAALRVDYERTTAGSALHPGTDL